MEFKIHCESASFKKGIVESKRMMILGHHVMMQASYSTQKYYATIMATVATNKPCCNNN